MNRVNKYKVKDVQEMTERLAQDYEDVITLHTFFTKEDAKIKDFQNTIEESACTMSDLPHLLSRIGKTISAEIKRLHDLIDDADVWI